MFGGIYRQRSVLITGHTGFKGSWMGYLLSRLGAVVTGFSLPPPHTEPDHASLLPPLNHSIVGDILDATALDEALAAIRPEIVFHLAAQALVGPSHVAPLETFAVNVQGTATVLEACRKSSSVRAVVAVTSDKCYLNHEWVWGYRETDRLGGADPYSASKACAELVAEAYRRSFGQALLIATARAGNVLGGGDWSAGRLVPDLMRDAAAGRATMLRCPDSVRPWQHVLEPLSGYLRLGQGLLEGRNELAAAWNFGPRRDEDCPTVKGLADMIGHCWPMVRAEISPAPRPFLESDLLTLDSSKAGRLIGWRPVWNLETALDRTAAWYRTYYESGQVNTARDVDAYLAAARTAGVAYAA
ncbi:CDP-glucose 4,6-dehydratase [Desulfolutivibrio sulfoxidireducens]|uniref:CDP-glucose 4,6-dehydratase n=1 Tax=Desulfolutivibrio sulfoxidireducens TaxID=2773299 RepID=UPI00159DC95A|nr:CDP-glucose 4,6-dehydratase [Desulfolutivibrio sulfoxidireducens]QLA18212.1 CDP-glucose 4,6-dehydratase [Desulfolutivibrio sulfoxidireducens]